MISDSNAARRGGPAALKIVLVYATVGALWILLSDRAVHLMFSDPAQWVRVSTYKGWLFIAATSLMLYLLMRRMHGRLLDAMRRESGTQAEKLRALQLLAAISEGSEDAIFAKDLEGRYILFNRAAGAIVGKPVERVLGQDDRAIFPPDQANMLMATGREVIKQDRLINQEEHLLTSYGERVFLSTKGPLRDADGRILGIFGISRDITERKRSEAELRELAEDLSATIRAIPDLLFELDEAGRYIRAETTAPNLLAAPMPQLIGRNVHDVLPAEAARVVMDAIGSAARNGSDYGRTIVLPLADGAHHFELSLARKAPEGPKSRHVVMLSRDITTRVTAEEELRRSYLDLQRFDAASVGRELRMIELKRQVNDLSLELGRAPPFDLEFAKTAAPASSGAAS